MFLGDDMSGISGHEIPMLSIPLISVGLSENAVVSDRSRDPSMPPIMTTQRNGNCFMAQPITFCWNYQCQFSANHVTLLSASRGLHHAVPAGDIPEGIVLPIACREAGTQPAERHSENMLKNDEILVQNLNSSKQQLDRKNCTVSQPQSVTVAMPVLSSDSRDKHRRARISKGVKALEELSPNHTQGGGRVSVLDDVIDYIKFLKLHLKALSQSRLSGEATSDPFLYLEGYGHFLFHDQLTGEPLEEIMGELMETDMLAAIQLLDSKGLSVIPIASANDLLQNN